MPKEKMPFSLLGHTKWEKLRNVVGLVLILAFAASRFVNVNVEQVSTIEIPASEYGINSSEALQSAVRSFQPSEATLASASKAVQSTVQDVKDNVALGFALGKAPPFVLVIECTSNWAKEKVGPVCDAIGSDFKNHLKSFKQ